MRAPTVTFAVYNYADYISHIVTIEASCDTMEEWQAAKVKAIKIAERDGHGLLAGADWLRKIDNAEVGAHAIPLVKR
jgi:hypothetical protein